MQVFYWSTCSIAKFTFSNVNVNPPTTATDIAHYQTFTRVSLEVLK